MENNKWEKYVEISIKELSLWDENARFPEEYFNKTEKELIAYFLNSKKFEIEKLAKEVVEEFDIPQFEEILVYYVGEKKVVLEGNRRLTVYKLLNNPLLTDDNKFQKFFKDLNHKVKIDNNFSMRAHVTDSKDDALRYINRKHNKGNNEVSWTSVERGHFAVRRKKGINKDVLKVEISRAVKVLNLPDKIKFGVLGKGYETTFWRIVENPSIRKKLGYDILEGGKLKIEDRNHFDEILKVIIYNVWGKEGFDGSKINSRDLNKSEQIENYSKKISVNDAKKVDQEIEKTKKKNKDLFGMGKVSKQNRKQSIYGGKEDIVKSLINNNKLQPKISSTKIKEVFKELKIIEVSSCATATFALVRILTDITIKTFLELKGYNFDNKGHLIVISGKEKNKTTLKEKMNYIAAHYMTGDIKASIVALNEDLLTQNLNQVMHNAIFCASEKQIRDFWKNLFPVLEFLWEEIIKIESKK